MSINSVVNDTVTGESVVNALKPKPPTISGYAISGADDTALDPSGGQTILLNGTGFQRGATVTLNGSAIAVVTYVNANQLSFTSPAQSAGTYTIYAVNADGGTGIYIPGLIYSNLPTWTTGAGSLGTYYETQTIASNVVASGDAPVTYSLFSGALPAGTVFNANGSISGSAPVDSGSTTYSFTVRATDAQLQDSNRSFTLTVNTDVVSWTNPAAGTTYTPTVNAVMANIGLTATSAAGSAVSYSANSLPTGVSLSGNTISGTPSATGSTSTLLTATATATSRSATRTINWTIAVASDSYFGYNTLLLPGASTTFVKDASSNNFAVTITGDIKPNSFNPYTPGYYSNYFDGSGDWIALPENALVLGASNFTFEAWIYPTATGQMTVINGQTNAATVLGSSFSFNINGDACYLYSGSSLTYSITSPTATVNAWSHVAFVRTGNTFSTYLNGTRISTTAGIGSSVINTGILGHHAKIGINGGVGATSYTPFTGYISNLRGIIGSGGYDATQTSITVPTSPLSATANTVLLTCQSNRFVDNSATPLTLTVAGNTTVNSFDPFIPNNSYSTYGSGYFDGTGDYLITPTDTAFTFGTGDFTIECWVYLTNSSATTQTIMGADLSVSTGSIQVWYNNTANKITFNVYGNPQFVSSSTVSVGNWIHLAFTRSSGTFNMFINGTQSASGSMTNNLPNNKFVIGRGYATIDAEYSYGYISDVRVVKGTAVYTTAFTPPSAPLTAISGTSLLTLQNNQPTNNSVFLDNSTNNFFVTRNGNATQGAFGPYGGNWSNYFDGNGDYLQIANNTAFNLSGGDFTLEAWVYVTALPPLNGGNARVACIMQYGSTTTNQGYEFTLDFTNNRLSLASVGTGNITDGSFSFALNTWYHVAATRSGSTNRLFVNGTSLTLVNNTFPNNSSPSGFQRIGSARLFTFYDHDLTGYISNARIVKGTALYTANFTPSTTPLTPVTGTSLLTCQSNRLIDNSINNFAITKNGDVSVQRFSPFSPASLAPTSYSWNLYTLGSYQVTRNSTLSSLSTGAFTVEGWYYPTSSISSQNARILSLGRDSVAAAGDTSWDLYISNGSALVWQRIQTTATTYSANYTFNLNTWYHVVACRDSSSNLALFVNGTRILLQANVTTNYDYVAGSNQSHYIGASYNNVAWSYALGYYSNIRVIKGATAYDPTQTTLTVPTTPLTATAQTSMLLFGNDGSELTGNYPLSSISRIDSQSSMSTFNPFGYTSATTTGYAPSTTGGSAYFDGTGDYINTQSNVAFTFGTGDLTLEGWIYQTATSSSIYRVIFGDNVYGSTGGYTLYSYNNALNLWKGGGEVIAPAGTITLNAWNHVAWTRSGSSNRLFINGTQVGATTTDATNYTSTISYIGASVAGTFPFAGYITDARIIKGQALYTSNFVPPSAPLTAVQNTVLLNNMTSAGAYDAAMMNNLETVGNTNLSTAVTKWGATSISFDGSGDYLIAPQYQNFDFGTGDFTVEAWIYMNSLPVNDYKQIVCFGTGSASQRWILFIDARTSQSNPYLRFLSLNSGGTVVIDVPGAGSSGWSAGTWYHVAVTRSGNTFKLFRDGVQNGATVTNAGSCPATASTGALYVGAEVGGGFANWNGYIDDLRITKGYARYTANFTPPTEAFMTK